MPEMLHPAVYDPAALGTMVDSQYALSPLDQRQALNTLNDDSIIPAYYFAPRHSTTTTYPHSAVSPHDDFPTPRARLFDMTQQVSPRFPVHSATYPPANRASRADSDFDSLYDITDDEAEVPLHASASVKKIATRPKRGRYPSIIIPSPSAWPTIEKLKSATSAMPVTPSLLLTPSRRFLEMIDSHNLQVPERSAAPSLDGSLTSEEMDKLSCPATPEIQRRRGSFSSVDSWGPVQLDLQAMETLQHLGNSPSTEQYEQQVPQSIEMRGEMQEVSRPSLGLSIPASVFGNGSSGSTPVSALSVPSPGGFFSSLQSNARHTWSIPKRQESVPNTSTAEKFYNLPWENRRNTSPHPVPALPQRISTLAGSTLDGFDEPLATSRPVILSPTDENVEIKEINPSKTIFQYNKNYNAELQKTSTANLEMTGRWLEEQDELQAALRDMNDISSPSLSSGTHSRENSVDKPVVKKSVKFAEEPAKSPIEEASPEPVLTYVQGLEYLRTRSQKKDTFIHRQTRAEAMHVQRRCSPLAHRDQLLGKFELGQPDRPAPPRPVSEFFVNDPTVLKERIARAQMERQALDQMLPIHWVLQAQKQLNGGKLLSKPAVRCITRASAPRILDVGGVATNDWAWDVAYDYPYATVTTVYTAGNNMSANVLGPYNHKHLTVPNLWTLPFPSGHFDVVSARTLYELLKTSKPIARSSDEYDLCLKECYRCLKPGGILDFSLMDADVVHAGRNAQAMGVEFGFNLKTRGYDAQPTKTFLPRVSKAGFKDVQRAWIVLPMGKTAANWRETLTVGAEPKQQERRITEDGEVELGDSPVYGTTIDAAMLTGVVGSWAWERWLLRLQMEMGKEEEKLLEGVVQRKVSFVDQWNMQPPVGYLERNVWNGAAEQRQQSRTPRGPCSASSLPLQACPAKVATAPRRFTTAHSLAAMLFFSFFKTLVEHEITVELKNEVQIRGTLKSVDQYLNIKLDNAEAVDEIRWPHLCSTKDMFIRGSVVRYVHLPSGAVDTALLEDATRREAEAAKNKAKQVARPVHSSLFFIREYIPPRHSTITTTITPSAIAITLFTTVSSSLTALATAALSAIFSVLAIMAVRSAPPPAQNTPHATKTDAQVIALIAGLFGLTLLGIFVWLMYYCSIKSISCDFGEETTPSGSSKTGSAGSKEGKSENKEGSVAKTAHPTRSVLSRDTETAMTPRNDAWKDLESAGEAVRGIGARTIPKRTSVARLEMEALRDIRAI
ncbi:hypothetical protein EJ02DRAFT_467488 [Clathrospora elynae]|uniref:Sm domain-containing protein n=1 Tax=Clathrospora elynae TaxID=706981 RepID=A0A6A5ST25_9PLEO|nr:hypothetical protein EJ02DRAFT_467488 [Clathrospora elynae]